ncbi:MAG: biotin transporter BioY, partial [Treponemataceae bacterium]|nr:biotin transporter BioY [Treponemataceae bacterium]
YTGKAGIQVLLHGPTMGFLWGYLLVSFLAGLALKIFLPQEKIHSQKKQWIVISVVVIFQSVIFFACGILGFMFITHATLQKAMLAVLVPFIPGNVIKIVLMIFLTKKFRPVIWNYTH